MTEVTEDAPTMVTIKFHGDEIVTCMHNGVPHVAMRRVVENLGMSWGSQHTKLANAIAKFMCTDIGTHDVSGRRQQMLAMPVAKLPLWLATINPNNITDPIKREKIELYQAESAIALHDYWTKGFALNDKRLDADEAARDDLAAEVRKLRTSDKALYRKLTDTIAATSVDYKLAPKKRISALFIRIQDTFHVAVAGMTAQELVLANADGSKPLVGMKAYAGDPARIKPSDVRTGKNYLEAIPFRKLEILYEQLLLLGEHRVLSGERLSLEKWADQIDNMLKANGYEPWKLYSRYQANTADQHAAHELNRYKARMKVINQAA